MDVRAAQQADELTKPAQAMELRSLIPSFGPTLE
jgi:hypothetical protein